MPLPQLPPVVYAPTMVDDDGQVRIRMHQMRDGQTALFVYSALDRFQACYSEGLDWVLVSVPQLEQAHAQAPFDLLLLDRELHPQEAAR